MTSTEKSHKCSLAVPRGGRPGAGSVVGVMRLACGDAGGGHAADGEEGRLG